MEARIHEGEALGRGVFLLRRLFIAAIHTSEQNPSVGILRILRSDGVAAKAESRRRCEADSSRRMVRNPRQRRGTGSG